jgi:LL-diaminopimelate aminotransferase
LPPYLFTEIDRARRQAEAQGQDVIDLGIGDPDRPTPAPLLQAMTTALAQPIHHRYPPNQGRGELRRAIAAWLVRRHHVDVDPDRNVQVLIGSKEGLAHLPLALLSEGDEVLVPDLGYPVYTQATILAGGTPVSFPLTHARGFRPELADLSRLVSQRTRLLYMNYPNNPTGALASKQVLQQVVELASRHGFAVAHDAAYLEVAAGPERPVSLLAVADPIRHRVIEFHSFSKMFNMTGWRIGFAVGHQDLIRDLGRVKESIDSGVFGAIQAAVAAVLEQDFADVIDQVTAVYPPRRAVLAKALHELGCEVFPTAATFYVWSRIGSGEGSLAFCQRILRECGVVLTPGIGFGPGGEGWLRASLTAPDARIASAAERLGRL